MAELKDCCLEWVTQKKRVQEHYDQDGSWTKRQQLILDSQFCPTCGNSFNDPCCKQWIKMRTMAREECRLIKDSGRDYIAEALFCSICGKLLDDGEGDND